MKEKSIENTLEIRLQFETTIIYEIAKQIVKLDKWYMLRLIQYFKKIYCVCQF